MSKPEVKDEEAKGPSPATGRDTAKVSTNIKVEDRTDAPEHDPYAKDVKVSKRKVGNVTIESYV